ncbi:MAG: glutathione S-transferase N-terminal domain-containing protein [Alphaproteobacteria bacterium]|nr:glutathione S-transferase N-terminal domain-containing protein [Alphaproteobacteria bacterium]
MIELWTWDTPNGRKISAALEEMGLPYSVHPVNISKNEQFNPEFLAFAPNNRIPAIRDPEGPDGQPITVFESGAILLYLAEKTGRFMPKDARGRVAVHEWLMWQMGGLGPMPGQVHHFLMQPEGAARDYGLAGRDFVATAGEPSIADFAIMGWAWRHERHMVPFDDLPNVAAWYERMMARPATKRGFEVKLN